MTMNRLRLRSQVSLVEKRGGRHILQGPVVCAGGLFFSRAYEGEILKVDREASQVLWRQSTVGRFHHFRVDCAAGGLVLGVSAQGVGAFCEHDGHLVWRRSDLLSVTSIGGAVLSLAEGAVVMVDAATGADVHRIAIGRERIMVAVAGEVILAPRHGLLDESNQADELARTYRSIRLGTGDVLWDRNLAKEVWEAAEQAPHFVMNLVEGSLGDSWIGRWQESTFACSRKDGRLQWVARDVACGLRATARDGRVFGMPMGGGEFFVLDERTGAFLGRHPGTQLEGAAYPGLPALLGEYVVQGMESGHLAVFDPRDGRLVWVKRHKSPLSDVRVIDGLVYVTTGKGELLVYEPAA